MRALGKVVEYLSKDGRILSGLQFGDCRITTRAFEGAICATHNRFSIEVQYRSFSRSHELRFLVGDIVKYCENRIRAYIFVKSKLTVYSLPSDIQAVIDEYFDVNLPKRSRPNAKKQAPEAYDVLYDLPRKALDLSNAARIESESWETTRELVEAFEETQISHPEEAASSAPTEVSAEMLESATEEPTLAAALGEYADCVRALAGGKGSENGTGGMVTKLNAAEMCMEAGCDMIIANGSNPDLLYDILEGKSVGTKFIGKR